MRISIERAAVLGSGVMGSAIAAHLANAGIPSLMLDVVPAGAPEGDRAARNRLGADALARALKAKPAPFFRNDLAAMVEIGNLEDDLPRIAEADWIIEVVKEDLAIKKAVLARAAKYRRPGSILTSNTSGLSIAAMAEGLDDDFRRHFLGSHFFNPPRYLKLLELIPGPDTDPELLAALAAFADRRLGKGVVIARDTPNFVANRIGVFGMLDTLRAMEEQGLTVEEVDFLTGPLVGRPKSASFRTADLVGLDTFVAVAGNVHAGCPDDEQRESFATPPLLARMIDKGLLGEKSGAGFYKKSRGADGRSDILTLDTLSLEHREKLKPSFPEIEGLKSIEALPEKVAALAAMDSRAGAFTWRTLSRLFAYCAHRVGEICDDPRPIDDGMKWGFAWEAGPFELWDAMGLAATVERMRADGIALPAWIDAMLEAGASSFYRVEDGAVAVWRPADRAYAAPPADPGKLELNLLRRAGAVVKRNEGASLMDLGDGVLGLEFHSKMNSIGGDILGITRTAVTTATDEGWAGIVVGNQGTNFSVGANLMLVLFAALEGDWDEVNLMIKAFQGATMAMKYSPVPVVVAPAALALGGGAEYVLHGQRVRAAAESYIGLVEVGVGLLPAGGGCKELYLRMLERWSGTDNLLPPVRAAFETIGMAKVSTSALEARSLGYLRDTDEYSMNRDRLIADAKATVLGMAHAGHDPGHPRTDIPVMGAAGLAALRVGLFNMADGGYISAHDRKIGEKVANVLCGGELTGTQRVTEEYLLELEREAFLSLVGEPKTLERIQHTLKTGKPLRN
ncbi:MAG: 3-hydroxyacyl-CoA dehydrogenase NAD-binding domain-containing protein [Candidatus Krumholzibacteriia bacterium]|nr:3-hydroxyacyl-CoA dehydrogenase/enoyl-CoA hydratase family protein [bacterium]